MRRFSQSITVSVIALALSACGGGGSSTGGGGGGSSISLTGSIDNTAYNVQSSPSLADRLLNLFGSSAYALGSGTTVDQIVAIPYNRANGQATLDAAVTGDLDADGRFSLGLDASRDYVLLLVNSKATQPQDKVVAYITMASSTTGDSVVSLPVSHANSSIDLGNVSPNASYSDEASGEQSAEDLAVDFSASLESLLARAKFDDAYKNLVNEYLNTSRRTWWRAQVQFEWYGGGDPSIFASSAPTDISAYRYDGYRVYFDNNSTEMDFSRLCDKTDTLEIAPPSPVTIIDQYSGNTTIGTIDTSTPADNGAVAVNGGDPNYCYDAVNSEMAFSANSGSSGVFFGVPVGMLLQDNPPDGWWTVRLNSTQKAVFELGAMKPVDTSGKPEVFLPLPSFTVDGAGKITGISVTWMEYNGSTYQAVNVSEVDDLVADSFIEIGYDGGGSGTEVTDLVYNDASSNLLTSATPVIDWDFNGSAGNPVSWIKMGYTMAGVNYAVVWEPGRL
ncbi:MAG TPA: hypothetical protein ENJ11_00735 [Gammaproteobacteria bacterium]|nr:hypothetical protein [Gammaproteobacteria bacterium]